MAAVSCTQCMCVLLLTIVLTWLPGEAVYFESAYSTSQKQDRNRNSDSSERHRRGRDRSRDNSDDDDESPASRRAERRRDPFQRTIVLCYSDDECGRKHFCHGGEGHKSCVACRKSRKRCHRNDMCCPGYECQDGRCRLRESRADNNNNNHNRDDEMSYSEADAEDSFWNVEVPRKKHNGEDCENSEDCMEGLCCARHFWSRVCTPMLDEGDLCTKKKDRISEIYQRCDCKGGLSCKRVPDINTRLHACFPVKTNQVHSELVVVDNELIHSRRQPDDNDIDNDVPLSSSGPSKTKRQSDRPSAERNEQRALFSIDPNPHRTDLKRSESHKDKTSQTVVVS